MQNKTVKAWLYTAIIALAIAGLFAVVLVVARSPHINGLVPSKDIFRLSLSLHVNLSVLVWMLAIACTIFAQKKPAKLTPYIALLGMAIMCGSFFSAGEPLLNNYVPVILHPSFFVGLVVFLAAVFWQAVVALLGYCRTSVSTQEYGAFSCAFLVMLSFMALLWSYGGYLELENTIGTAQKMEHLFWGGGHILQYAYTQMLLWVWMGFVQQAGCPVPKRLALLLYSINIIVCLLMPFGYVGNAIDSYEHRQFFTQHMMGCGAAPTILLLWCLGHIKRMRFSYHMHGVVASVLLFMSGGMIALCIDGVNTIIPAHYHGSIVGVSLALMAWVYYRLPQLGFAEVSAKKMAAQLYLYAAGQLIHIIGLAWSGGYGALRKTPGAMESVAGKTAMGLMGFGGLLSIIGGLLFVIYCWKSISKNK